jgi:hypothetical protein
MRCLCKPKTMGVKSRRCTFCLTQLQPRSHASRYSKCSIFISWLRHQKGKTLPRRSDTQLYVSGIMARSVRILDRQHATCRPARSLVEGSFRAPMLDLGHDEFKARQADFEVVSGMSLGSGYRRGPCYPNMSRLRLLTHLS